MSRDRTAAWLALCRICLYFIKRAGYRRRHRPALRAANLQHGGKCAIWEPGIDHSWRADEDSIVISVPRPSLPHCVGSTNPLTGTHLPSPLCWLRSRRLRLMVLGLREVVET
jgi:hypothetical protein